MSKLKSCPFCGGEARIDTEYDMDGFGNFQKVECKSCGASSKAHFCSQGNECPQYYQEVRDDWQGRVETETEKRLTAIATKHATRCDELYEALECICSYVSEDGLITTGLAKEIVNAQRLLNKSRTEADK